MNEQDCKAIAKILKAERPALEDCDGDYYTAGRYDLSTSIACELADYFATQTSNFNRQQFLNACGVDE